MEPGREDREYENFASRAAVPMTPQWNPAVKTGSTGPKRSQLSMLTSGLNGTRP